MSSHRSSPSLCFFFFNDTATTEIYTLSLHDALPILCLRLINGASWRMSSHRRIHRSEEHTSELQSPCNLVCRLLLEKKTTRNKIKHYAWAHYAGRHAGRRSAWA